MKCSARRVLILTAWAIGHTVAPALAKEPTLDSAGSFAVLGGTAVISRGTSRVTGNVGVSPGDRVSGFADGSISLGAIYRDDALARSAQIDARRAAEASSSGPCIPATFDGVLAPGIYCVTSPLEGTLTLDGGADAVWIFRSAGALRVEAGSSVVVTNGANATHVFWQVAGSVTLGPRTQFAGNLLAEGDITLEAGAALYGRALSRGTVTLDGNVVTICCNPITLSDLSAGGVITAAGATAPVTFTASALPPGWSLSPGGVLTHPIGPERVTFTITATDAAGCTGSRAYAVWPGELIPTLSEWLLAGLAALIAMAGIRSLS